MRTPDEIKKALRLCFGIYSDFVDDVCEPCPYREEGPVLCRHALCRDVLDSIEQLEERVSLMLIQMKGDCGVCKHRNERPSEGSPCNKCAEKDGRPLWEYEGLPEVPKKGASA